MQISNPFDDVQGQFYLLQNEQRQYSLWPAQCALPAGWRVIREPQSLDACNAWLGENWPTLLPSYYASQKGAA